MKSPEQVAQDHLNDVAERRRREMVRRLIEAVKTLADADVTEGDLEQDENGYYWTWNTIYRLRPDNVESGAHIERLISDTWVTYKKNARRSYGDFAYDNWNTGVCSKAQDIAEAIDYFNDCIRSLQKKKKRGLFGR